MTVINSDTRILSDRNPVRQPATPPETKKSRAVRKRIEWNALRWSIKKLSFLGSADDYKEASAAIDAINTRIMESL